MGQSPNKITRLEDAEAGVTVTVAMPWESVTEWEATSELDEAIELDTATEREAVTEQEAATELEAASELEAARERTMTCAQPLNGLIVMVLPTGRSTSLNPGSPLPQPRKTALSTLTSNSVSEL